MKRWSLPILIVLAVVGVLAGRVYFTSGWSRGAMLSRQIATQGLAEQLHRASPKAKVLVVSNPLTTTKGQPKPAYLGEQAGIKGLQKVFGKESMTVAYPQLKRGALENPRSFEMPLYTTTPIAYLLAEGAFDTLAQKNPKCEYIVSLIGIPPDYSQLQLWQRNDGPKLAFLLPDLWMLGNKQAIAGAFKTGKISAAVINKPDMAPQDVLDSGADFSKRFVLLTGENIEEMIVKYPQVFEAPEGAGME
jgi:hypothetical protein